MSPTRLHEVEQALATFRGFQHDLETVRKDFAVEIQPSLPTDLTRYHLRRQLTELGRHIRDAARSAFSESSPEYREVDEFGRLGPGHRDISEYFHLLDRLVFALERDRLRHVEVDKQAPVPGLDVVTDFYSRDLLLRLLEQEIAWTARKGETLALLLLRIGHWSTASCTVPPTTRKELIIAIASILKTTVRPYDFVFRTGEAEFAAVLREADAVVAANVTKRIGEAFGHAMPHVVEGTSLHLEMATSTFPFDAEGASDLLSRTQRKWA